MISAPLLLSLFFILLKYPYILVGIIMWVATLKSGVHATLAGALVAIFIPIRSKADPSISPLKSLEHDLHHIVAFIILPIFAFANAGINVTGVGIEAFTHSVPIGIIFGFFFGKIIGIFGLCWIAIKINLIKLPDTIQLPHLLGTSALCGIGFTMSLFIGSLAFEETGVNLLFDERLGIIIGSLLSGITGYLILKLTLKYQ